MLQLFVGTLVVAYERDAVGLVVRVTSVRDSLVVEQSQVGVGVVVVGGYVPETGRPDVHRAEAPILPAGVAEIRARLNTELRTDSLVRGDVVRVADLAEDWRVRLRVLALNAAHLVQDLAGCVVHMKLVKRAQLLA